MNTCILGDIKFPIVRIGLNNKGLILLSPIAIVIATVILTEKIWNPFKVATVKLYCTVLYFTVKLSSE